MKLMLLSTLLMMMLALFSCKSKQPLVINNHTQTTVRDSIVKDTITKTLHDSAFLELYLKCVDGRVVIDKELQKMSRNLSMIHKFDNGLLTVQSDYYNQLKMEFDRVYRIIEKQKETTVIQPPIQQPKSKWWERMFEVLIIIGVVFILILILRKL
jgi:hypothetical protein